MSRKSLQESAKESRARQKSAVDPFVKIGHAPRASEYMRSVEAVPTVFPHFDLKTGIGGFPVRRIVVVHGPSTEGKSLFALGVMHSYLLRNHVVGFADAERTTTPEFARQFMAGTFESPNFRSVPVRTYEQVRRDVRSFFQSVEDGRRSGDFSPETRALVVVDSLKNLMPEAIWDELEKDARSGGPKPKGKRKGGVDGYGGRAGQLQASYNTAWFVELASVLDELDGTILVIVREKIEESNRMFGEDKIVLVGGREVRFGNHLQLRVSRTEILDDDKRLVGERHGVETHKTKLAGRSEAFPFAVFHTRFGETHGFDRARDVFEAAHELGVIEQSGAWYSWREGKLGQGAENAISGLREDAALLAAIEDEARARFPRGR